MPKLLAALFITALGMNCSASAQDNDPTENYQVMQKRCNRLKEAERDKCLQEAKQAYERSTTGCEILTGTARKKCLADVQAHQQSAGAQPPQSAIAPNRPTTPTTPATPISPTMPR